jgi:hypothetical protein
MKLFVLNRHCCNIEFIYVLNNLSLIEFRLKYPKFNFNKIIEKKGRILCLYDELDIPLFMVGNEARLKDILKSFKLRKIKVIDCRKLGAVK